MIRDERFSTDHTDQYHLVFEIQYSSFRFMVKADEQVFWLEDHFLGNSNDLATCLKKCSHILKAHPFLPIPNWRTVRVISDLQLYTLIPSQAFTPAHVSEYLEHTYPAARISDFEITNQSVSSHQLIMGTPLMIYDFFAQYYPNVVTLSALAGAIKHLTTLHPDQTLGIIGDTFITLCCVTGKNKVLRTRKMPLDSLSEITAHTPHLTLYGEVTPFSRTFLKLEEKFDSVTIGEWSGPLAQDLPWHRYFTLLNAEISEMKISDRSRIEL